VHKAVPHNALSEHGADIARGQRDHLALAAIVAAALALWIVCVGYSGIIHDAHLYSLQALARLHPDLLGQDLYLRFGSQDRFTLFSPIYSTLIAWLGLEPAAALLTVLSHLAFYASAAFLARQLLPARLALLSVALLVAVPGGYGPGDMFHTVEPFITPRMAAEALVLTALAAALSKKYVLVAVCLVAALLLHPLMAMAGVALLLVITVALPRPRLTAILGGAALLALAVLLALVPSLRFDEAWRAVILDRVGYVFLSRWSPESWVRTLVPLVTLTAALLVLGKSRPRRIGTAALVLGLGGLLLTFYGADLLHFALITQSQPWRWLWLTNTVTIILLPLIFSACWQRGDVGRATIAAIVSMWLFRNDAYGLVLMPVAIALAAYSRAPASRSPATRMLWFGSLAIVAFGIAWNIANNALFAGVINPLAGITKPVELFRGVGQDGLAPVAVLFIVWAVARLASRAAQAAIAVLACAAGLCLLPFALKEWTAIRFSEAAFESLASWRDRIPVGTEVLWIEAPVDAWILLQRPLYLTLDHGGSVLFSRGAALEMQRRDAVLARFLPQAHFMMPKTHASVGGETTLARACSSGELEFIITRLDLKAPALENAPADSPLFRGLHLYRCTGSNE
jgi:hypothetical protein